MILGALIFVALQILAVNCIRECSPNQEKVYFFPHTSLPPVSWTEALAMCGRDGMSLATIKDKKEFTSFMIKLSKDGDANKQYWLGASCEGRCELGKKGWYWITDHSRLDSNPQAANNWAPNQPTNSPSAPVLWIGQTKLWYNLAYDGHALWVCHDCRSKPV